MANKKQLLSLVFTTSEMHRCYEHRFEGEQCYATQTSSQTAPFSAGLTAAALTVHQQQAERRWE